MSMEPGGPTAVTRSKACLITVRILIASVVGLSVCGTAILVSWRAFGRDLHPQASQLRTIHLLWKLDVALQAYQETHHALPTSLHDLRSVEDAVHYLPFDEDGVLRDGWDRPLVYSADGAKGTVISYGRDGKPGGIGLDCDLSRSAPFPREAFPTLRQFLFELPTEGVVKSCVWSGVLAFILTIIVVRPVHISERRTAAIATEIGLTVVGTVILSGIITAFHVVSGH